MSDEIRQFNFTFTDLHVIPASIEMLMGFYPGPSPEPFPELILSALSEASDLFEVKAGYRRIGPVTFMKETRQIEVSGKIFSPGKIIFNEIKNSPEVAFFTGTAGNKVSHRCRALNETGDFIYSYVLDVLGSVVAEKAVEKMMEFLESEVSDENLHISESYSPGYCNWNVAEQQILFSFLPVGFCGITLSPSSLMSPVKSISGIIGIGPGQNRNDYKCRRCNDKTCIYGRIRREKNLM